MKPAAKGTTQPTGKRPAKAAVRTAPVEESSQGFIPLTAGKQTPRRLRRAVQILETAREMFFEKGFERTSVGEIAARVGVVEGLLYSYFPTKRELLNEVLRGSYEPLIQDFEDGFSRLSGLRSRLRFVIWRHLRVYIEEPSLSRIVLHEVRTGPEYFQSIVYDLHIRYTSFLVRTIRDAVADGELPPDTDAEMIRCIVYGGIEHRMWPMLFGRGSIDVEAVADSFTETLLQGILPPQKPATASTFSGATLTDVEQRLSRVEKLLAAKANTRSGSEADTKAKIKV